MTRQTGDAAGDKIRRKVTRQSIPRKVLLTRDGDAGEGGRPKPRGKLRFLHVVLEPAQFAVKCRLHGSWWCGDRLVRR